MAKQTKAELEQMVANLMAALKAEQAAHAATKESLDRVNGWLVTGINTISELTAERDHWINVARRAAPAVAAAMKE